MEEKKNPNNERESEAHDLNENHRNALSATLGTVARDLYILENYMKHTPHGGMHRVVNDLTTEEEVRILSAIKACKECIEEFAGRYRLKPTEISIRNAVHGNFAICWSDVCDRATEKLGSYGPIGADAAQELDQYIARLKTLLEIRL